MVFGLGVYLRQQAGWGKTGVIACWPEVKSREVLIWIDVNIQFFKVNVLSASVLIFVSE